MNKKDLKRLARKIASNILQSSLEANVLQTLGEAHDAGLSEEEKLSLEQAIYDIIMQLRQQ